MVSKTTSTRWRKGDTTKVFNAALSRYRDSIIDPWDLNHGDVLFSAQDDTLSEDKHKTIDNLCKRATLRKETMLRLLAKEKKADKGRQEVITGSKTPAIQSALYPAIQDIVSQQIIKKLEEIFTPDFKAQVRQAVLTSVTNPQNITGYISGTFNGTFTPEKPKIQPLAPVPTVQRIAPIVKEEVKVIYDDTLCESLEINEESDLLRVAVIGVDEKNHNEIRKAANHIHRMIDIKFFVNPGLKIMVPRIPANYDYIFIVKIEGLDAAEEVRLLANGYHRYGNFEILQPTSNKNLGQMIVDWSIKERKKREGIGTL